MDALARRWGIGFNTPRFSLRKRLADELKYQQLILIKPLTFMNLSGQAVQSYQTKLGLKPEEILLIHDDLDMPLGRIRFKLGGGAGGQKGVQDTIRCIGENFLRLKVGIGRPPESYSVERWVLSPFISEEETLKNRVIEAAADAVDMLLNEGLEPAMNKFNGLDLNRIMSSEAKA